MTVTDWLWVRSPLKETKYLLKFIFPFLCSGVERKNAAISSATQHAMPPEFGRKWLMECKTLTLVSLCLCLCVRDTALSCFFLYIHSTALVTKRCVEFYHSRNVLILGGTGKTKCYNNELSLSLSLPCFTSTYQNIFICKMQANT